MEWSVARDVYELGLGGSEIVLEQGAVGGRRQNARGVSASIKPASFGFWLGDGRSF